MPLLAILDEQRATLATVQALAQYGVMQPASGRVALLGILAVVACGEMTVREILDVTPCTRFPGC